MPRTLTPSWSQRASPTVTGSRRSWAEGEWARCGGPPTCCSAGRWPSRTCTCHRTPLQTTLHVTRTGRGSCAHGGRRRPARRSGRRAPDRRSDQSDRTADDRGTDRHHRGRRRGPRRLRRVRRPAGRVHRVPPRGLRGPPRRGQPRHRAGLRRHPHRRALVRSRGRRRRLPPVRARSPGPVPEVRGVGVRGTAVPRRPRGILGVRVRRKRQPGRTHAVDRPGVHRRRGRRSGHLRAVRPGPADEFDRFEADVFSVVEDSFAPA